MNSKNMHGEPNLPVRRSAVVNRQRLGILPTMAVWNDPEMQRLVFPILVVTSLPLFPLMLYLQRVLDVSTWLVLAGGLLYPYLIMGLVERHVRRRPPPSPSAIRRHPPGDRAPPMHHAIALLFSVMGFSIAALVALGAGELGILVALVLTAVGSLGIALRTRRATLMAARRSAMRLPAPNPGPPE